MVCQTDREREREYVSVKEINEQPKKNRSFFFHLGKKNAIAFFCYYADYNTNKLELAKPDAETKSIIYLLVARLLSDAFPLLKRSES